MSFDDDRPPKEVPDPLFDAAPKWRGPVISEEPPPEIRHVRESDGYIADRLGPCGECCGDGSIWRWRHNGGEECWFEIDGIGPWEGWK